MRVVHDSTEVVGEEVRGGITAIMLPSETVELQGLVDDDSKGLEVQDWITDRIPHAWEKVVKSFNWEYEIDLEYNVLSLTVCDVGDGYNEIKE